MWNTVNVCLCLSDSGDSLFITQKPVPKAVRSARRRHSSCKSHPTYPSELSENEEDSSSSADSEVEEEIRGENEPKLQRLKKWRKRTTQPLRQNRIICVRITNTNVDLLPVVFWYKLNKLSFLFTESYYGGVLYMCPRLQAGLKNRRCAVIFTNSWQGRGGHLSIDRVSLFK